MGSRIEFEDGTTGVVESMTLRHVVIVLLDTTRAIIPNSRTVYFLNMLESSLEMGATVRFPSNIKSEVLKDEINTSVFKALKENGIEIPYAHVDVKMR